MLENCATGFHFASLHEIMDTSALKYDKVLGATGGDAGEGAPAGPLQLGWIRTGRNMSQSAIEGDANCDAWTTTSGRGSGAWLDDIGSAGQITAPWRSFTNPCTGNFQIWCVQD